MGLIDQSGLMALLEIIAINVVLSGDNAIVIGLAAAGLPPAQRSRAIVYGILAATVMRIVFALAATRLLETRGVLMLGGLLLLWVCWKMWSELRAADAEAAEIAAHVAHPHHAEKTMAQATWQIIVADVSMSLDNVLAVTGAARNHVGILVFGLVVSILLMGLAAAFIARLLGRYRWIAYVGLAIILYVALKMIWDGALDLYFSLAG